MAGSDRAREAGPRPSRRSGRRGTKGFRAVEQQRELQARPPWWGRLEARITISLVAIGILCVGASSYLVALTVQYYDQVSEQQVELQDQALRLAEPYYEELAAAQREAFRARTQLLPHELRELDGEALEAFLDDWIRARGDVVEVVVERHGAEAVIVGRQNLAMGAAETGAASLDAWIHVPLEWPLGEAGGLVRVTWAVDPAIRTRHQALGELARDLGAIEVKGAGGEDRMAERDEVRRAVIAALTVASSLVLFVAILAGILIARRTTRKVSDLSEVMRRVASGDLSVRAPRLGADELGQLSSAFNTMLEELEHTRRRIAYLQRVGAWQEMARRIAHEIKNPLTPIQLAVQQLREKDPGNDARFSALLRDSVEIVEDEVEALRRMVTSFSQFAKLPEVELEPVALARILVEFERAYTHVDAALEIDLGAEGIEVLGDRQLLKQVLVNLAENAALSAREAGVEQPRIRVSAVARVELGVACLVVEDNGPGVALERRELVFEPYETTRAQGTGLGLAIVKKIVLDHGGEILVGGSEELGGARFEVRLRVSS
ncbi:Nitrogen regulation protein NtrY [Enhygromyxa salina]|uniref:histidine kinase n=1 Tax=Enhygromyxa salina TaxID=215803 RepID=A0A0C1ZPF9_9BACT|nr:ATP-binding protein [Enhygromyxa salina]KIG12903.1 Nitrogen regulation protein NtrY [Enhygromyxa salina]